MDAKTIKSFVNDHPDGVIIRMIDGTEYFCPHRDYIWLTPTFGSEARALRSSTSFWIADAKTEETRLVNALLVAELIPMHKNGNGRGKPRRRKAG